MLFVLYWFGFERGCHCCNCWCFCNWTTWTSVSSLTVWTIFGVDDEGYVEFEVDDDADEKEFEFEADDNGDEQDGDEVDKPVDGNDWIKLILNKLEKKKKEN